MKKHLRMVISLFLMLFGADQAVAQYSTITVTQGLSFGTNITGTTTLAYTSPGAAAFQVAFPNYSQAATLSLTFILPSNLTDAAGDNLPISFATNSAAYHVNVNSTAGATAFNPNNGLNGTLGQTAHVDYFWLGGTVTPGNNYIASDYSGTITIVSDIVVGTQHYTSTETITVTATLLGNISISATGALDFGLVVAGTTPPSLSALAGGAPQFIATGVRNNRSIVTFSSTSTLNDGYGNTLTFTPSLYGSATNSQAGSQPITSGTTLSPGRRNTNYYFWLGGSLAPVPTGQPPGSYSGVFILTVVR